MDQAQTAQYLRRAALASYLRDGPNTLASELRRTAAAIRRMDAHTWEAWLAGTAGADMRVPKWLAAEVRSLAREGLSPRIDELMAAVPPGLFDLVRLRGLNEERVRRLWKDLGVISINQLDRAIRRGRLDDHERFGPQMARRLADAIAKLHKARGYRLRKEALAQAERREEELRQTKGLLRLQRAGELRRGNELVGALVWVAEAEDPNAVLGRLGTIDEGALDPPGVPDRVLLYPEDGLPEEVVVVDPRRFPARLFLETGSRAHVRLVLSRLARSGLAYADGGGEGSRISWLPASEEEIYRKAGLQFVPPELREARGEIGAAASGTLPRLLEAEQIRGAIHIHSRWSDGKATIEEIVREAIDLGWSYVGIADHSKAAFYAGGLSAEDLLRQAKEIHSLRKAYPQIRIFHGVECDILPDGSLDYTEEEMEHLDFVIVSVHSATAMAPDAMTERIIKAIEHPRANILAHPSGRLLLERGPIRADWERILDAAASHGVAIEFNTVPRRLDLDWRLIRTATRKGVKIMLNPDAHDLAGMHSVYDGLPTARKGWLTAEQTLNALDAERLEAFFQNGTTA